MHRGLGRGLPNVKVAKGVYQAHSRGSISFYWHIKGKKRMKQVHLEGIGGSKGTGELPRDGHGTLLALCPPASSRCGRKTLRHACTRCTTFDCTYLGLGASAHLRPVRGPGLAPLRLVQGLCTRIRLRVMWALSRYSCHGWPSTAPIARAEENGLGGPRLVYRRCAHPF